jgi:hypothetical protein
MQSATPFATPVHARLCERPEQWRWSSQAAVLGLVPPGRVAVNELLRLFHHDRQTARKLYREFTDSDEDARGTHPLVDGDEHFTSEHLDLIPANPAYPKRLLRPLPPPLETILNPSPTAPELAAAHAAGPLTAIANHLNLHKSTIGRRLARGFTSDEASQPQPDATSET